MRGILGESVGIGRLERFVADYHMNKKGKAAVKAPESNGHRVAVVGSGPAGLTCAGDLRKMGYDVTIFEAFHKSGGVLVYGIPQFRLPKGDRPEGNRQSHRHGRQDHQQRHRRQVRNRR